MSDDLKEPDPSVIKLPTAPKDDFYERIFPGGRARDRQKLDETIAANQRGELTELQKIEISNNAARAALGLPHLSDEELVRKVVPQTGPRIERPEAATSKGIGATPVGKKVRRKGGPELNAAQRRMNLAMALLRAEAAVIPFNEWSRDLPPTTREKFLALKQELMTQEIGPVGLWFSYLQLYFATIHVIVNTWRRGKLTNPQIDALAGDQRIVQLLTDFRDDLMHGGSFLGDEVSAFFDNLSEIDAWALKLRQACEGYVVTYFATPRENNDN